MDDGGSAKASEAVERVLAGQASYDELDEADQALVRAEWDVRIAAAVAALNFEEEFRKSGLWWAEADSDGNVIIRHPD